MCAWQVVVCITPYLQFHIASAGTALEEMDFVRSIKGFTKLDKIKNEAVLNQLFLCLWDRASLIQ